MHRAGRRYYPKLQIAAPFTPANGPRLLLSDTALAQHLLKGAEVVCEQNGLSSAHATFIEPDQVPLFEVAGWLMRSDIQFHWLNRNYHSFDDFLDALASRKRKNLRKERARAIENDITIHWLTGDDIRPEHWDAFWIFYQDTGARKWGTPYLTRAFFEEAQETLRDDILLLMAWRDGRWVAGALNFIGSQALFGRYWGCIEHHPCAINCNGNRRYERLRWHRF